MTQLHRPRLPDFIIVGAMKSGTTTLFDHLSHAPGCHLPSMKEPAFFSNPDRQALGLDWYSSLFADVGPDMRTGEASVAYTDPIHADAAAERIRSTLPGVRIVFVMRHPIERMRSHYRHQLQRGRELRAPQVALATVDSPYAARSMYATCFRPYLLRFDQSQIFLTTMEELLSVSRETEWLRLLAFLGLEPVPRPQEVANVTAEKRQFSQGMARLWKSGRYRHLRPLVPKRLRRVVYRSMTNDGGDFARYLTESHTVSIPAEVETAVWSDVALLDDPFPGRLSWRQ